MKSSRKEASRGLLTVGRTEKAYRDMRATCLKLDAAKLERREEIHDELRSGWTICADKSNSLESLDDVNELVNLDGRFGVEEAGADDNARI